MYLSGSTGIYEIIPAFICSTIVAVVVSLIDKKPSAEVEELLTLCRWTNDTINGQIGYTVEGPSGKTIFLPASGFKSVTAEAPDSCSGLGYYWTGTHTKGRAEKQKAFAWNFNTNDTLKAVVEIERFHGMLVRPVAKN
jgi:hypothetical protein